MLKIKSFCGGYDHNFCYLIYDDETSEAAIIDTAIELNIIMPFIKQNNLKLKFSIVMHGHFDHKVGLDFYRENRITLIASEKSKENVDIKVKDNDELQLGNYKLKIIYTPGHIYDAICVLVDNKLFTSDTLFIDTIGTCRLPGANREEIYDSLYNKLLKLPEEVVVYSGHDYGPTKTATIAEQKKSNRYLQSKSKEEFLRVFN
tara:strand:- start:213 stop:821 length:609 start_codon:yes stop_codon:yes gene_type:complete